jgi:hypothetical protein
VFLWIFTVALALIEPGGAPGAHALQPETFAVLGVTFAGLAVVLRQKRR